MNTNSYAPIGDLPTYANSIILYNFEQDDVDITNVYAGGNFNNGTQHTGLGYISSSAGPTALWNQAAETSQYMEYYMGDVFTLIYTTGVKKLLLFLRKKGIFSTLSSFSTSDASAFAISFCFCVIAAACF